ncbi:MAG: DNA methylase [Anaeroplasma sp.]
MEDKEYICIDLKSFYASVECVFRNLDPLVTNLVVADETRTEKTICLAVTPALKSFGIPGRARLFEVIQMVERINKERKKRINNKKFSGESCNIEELNNNPYLKLSFLIAPPQMAKYIEMSTKIYNIYLKYIAPEDIHVYSIDEVFMDVTDYLKIYNKSSHEFAKMLINDVLTITRITATAGIGTNMYLSKVAMDIVAKHIPADENGVRIAQLDEMSYREQLWNHKPLTDFWRVGHGINERLNKLGLYTMGDIARCSLGDVNKDYYNENLLYKEFGVNAELLIDHAWGYEPTTIKDVKSYRPKSNSLSSGQVLSCGYDYNKTKIIIKEMADLLTLDLVNKGLVTNNIALYIGYDIENLKDQNILEKYQGEISTDYVGRMVPKSDHKSISFDYTSSTNDIMSYVDILFNKTVNPLLLVRKVNISANNLISEEEKKHTNGYVQLNLFTDYDQKNIEDKKKEEEYQKEKKLQHTIINLKSKYGKNAILKGMNLEEGATTIERNGQIGGHKA